MTFSPTGSPTVDDDIACNPRDCRKKIRLRFKPDTGANLRIKTDLGEVANLRSLVSGPTFA